MPADPNEEIDRLTAELATYRHAFETTEADRDRWAARARELQERLDSAATAAARGATPQQPASSDDASLPPIDLAVQHRLARRLQLGQTAGHYFFIDVVGTCNLRCPSCAVGNAPAQLAKGLMSVATFDKILSKIRAEYSDCGRLFVDLYNWGEPGLHPDLSSSGSPGTRGSASACRASRTICAFRSPACARRLTARPIAAAASWR
jgi:hypothetical protein